MKINYTISKDDLLTFHLYGATHSDLNKSRELKVKMIMTGFMAILSVILYAEIQSFVPVFITGALIIILWLLYPVLRKRQFRRYFKQLIHEKMGDRIGESMELETDSKGFILRQSKSMTRIAFGDIESIINLKDIFLIRVSPSQAVLIPKTEINELADVTDELKNIATANNIDFVDEILNN